MSSYIVGADSYTAVGNIGQCVFVTSAGFKLCCQSTAGDLPLGVSQKGASTFAMQASSTPVYGATNGQPLMVYLEPAQCNLFAGAGGHTPAAFLTPDTNGFGVLTASPFDPTAGQGPIGARAIRPCNANQLGLVQVGTKTT